MITRYIVEQRMRPFWASKKSWYVQDELDTKHEAEQYVLDVFDITRRKDVRIRIVRHRFKYVRGQNDS